MKYRPDKLRRSFFFKSLLIGIVFSTIPLKTVVASENLDTKWIMVLGDSISAGYGMNIEEGWVNLLKIQIRQESPQWKIRNASISGETTGGALARLPDLMNTIKPRIVIVELGGNDGLRGYPIEKMRSNLEKIAGLIQDGGATPVIMSMRIPPNYGGRYTQAFADTYSQVAKLKKAPLIPFAFEQLLLEEDLMQEDGIHPSNKAQPILMEVLESTLACLLNEP